VDRKPGVAGFTAVLEGRSFVVHSRKILTHKSCDEDVYARGNVGFRAIRRDCRGGRFLDEIADVSEKKFRVEVTLNKCLFETLDFSRELVLKRYGRVAVLLESYKIR
jgi:hypothetical protein